MISKNILLLNSILIKSYASVESIIEDSVLYAHLYAISHIFKKLNLYFFIYIFTFT